MKSLSFAIALAAVALTPLAALAHGPVRQKVDESVSIAAPPEKVWARVGKWDDMSWLPGVFSTEAEGAEKGAKRTLTLENADGPKIVEELDKYDAAKMQYKYRIDSVDVKVLPVTNYSSTIEVEPGDGGGSVVHWKGAFYRGFPNNNPPPELNDEAALAAVTKLYQAGLAALKSELEATN